MEELLKSLGLEQDTIKSILKGMKDNKIFTSKEENIDERYNKLKSQKTDLEEQLKTSNDTIDTLKKANKDNEELQKEVEDYKVKMETLKADSDKRVRDLTLNNAIDTLLTKNKAKHSDLLSNKFDRDKIVINEDGTLSGLDEQFKSIKENYKDLFEEKITGVEPPKGARSVNQEEPKDQALEAFDKFFMN